MTDFAPQVAAGKVLLHFTMSLDGFVAGPGDDMSWMTGFTGREGVVEDYVSTTGAVLGGRRSWDRFPKPGTTYGGAWSGPLFILTHHPEDATPADGVTFLSCDLSEAVRIGLASAAGKNLEVFSPTIGRQLLGLGLIDEIDLHIAPVLLGDGIRLYDVPGAAPVLLDRLGVAEPRRTIDLRFRPASTSQTGAQSPPS